MKILYKNIYEQEQFEKALQEKIQLKLGAEDFSGTLSELKDKIITLKTESKLSEQELKSQEEIIKGEFFKKLKSLYGNGYSDNFYWSRSWHIINNKSEEISRLYNGSEVKTKGFSFMKNTQIKTNSDSKENKENNAWNKLKGLNDLLYGNSEKKFPGLVQLLQSNDNALKEAIGSMEWYEHALSAVFPPTMLIKTYMQGKTNEEKIKNLIYAVDKKFTELSEDSDIISSKKSKGRWLSLNKSYQEIISGVGSKNNAVADILKGELDQNSKGADLIYAKRLLYDESLSKGLELNKVSNKTGESKMEKDIVISIDQSLDELYKIHLDIDKGRNGQYAVMRNKQYLQKLHTDLFQRILSENGNKQKQKQQIIKLVCIMTGRMGYYQILQNQNSQKDVNGKIRKIDIDNIFQNSSKNSDYIDDDQADFENAIKFLDQTLQDENIFEVVLDKLGMSIPSIESHETYNGILKGSNRFNSLNNRIMSLGSGEHEGLKSIANSYLQALGGKTIKSRENCSVEEKIIYTQLNNFVDSIYGKIMKSGDYKGSMETYFNELSQDSSKQQAFAAMLGNANIEAQGKTTVDFGVLKQKLNPSYRSLESGKWSKDFSGWKSIEDRHIFDLYQSILGTGKSLGDSVMQTRNTVGKVISTLVVTIGATIATAGFAGPGLAGLAVSAVTGTVAGAAADQVINQTGYGTISDAIVDRGSEIIIGTATGMLGGALAKSFMGGANVATKFIGKGSGKNILLGLADRGAGVGAEYERINYLDIVPDQNLQDVLFNPVALIGLAMGLANIKTLSKTEHTNLLRNINTLKRLADADPSIKIKSVEYIDVWGKKKTTTVGEILESINTNKPMKVKDVNKIKSANDEYKKGAWIEDLTPEARGAKAQEIINNHRISKDKEEIILSKDQINRINKIHNLNREKLSRIIKIYEEAQNKKVLSTNEETKIKDILNEEPTAENDLLFGDHNKKELAFKSRLCTDFAKIESSESTLLVRNGIIGNKGNKTIDDVSKLLTDEVKEFSEDKSVAENEAEFNALEQQIREIDDELAKITDDKTSLENKITELDEKIGKYSNKNGNLKKNKDLVTIDTLEGWKQEKNELQTKLGEEEKWTKLRGELGTKKGELEGKKDEFKPKLDRKVAHHKFNEGIRDLDELLNKAELEINDGKFELHQDTVNTLQSNLNTIQLEFSKLRSSNNERGITFNKQDYELKINNIARLLKTKTETYIDSKITEFNDIKKKLEGLYDNQTTNKDHKTIDEALEEGKKLSKKLEEIVSDLETFSNFPTRKSQIGKLNDHIRALKSENSNLQLRFEKRKTINTRTSSQIDEFTGFTDEFTRLEKNINNDLDSIGNHITEEDLKKLKQKDMKWGVSDAEEFLEKSANGETMDYGTSYRKLKAQIDIWEQKLIEFRNKKLNENTQNGLDRIKKIKESFGDLNNGGKYTYYEKNAGELNALIDETKSELIKIDEDIEQAKKHGNHATNDEYKSNLTKLESQKNDIKAELQKMEEYQKKVQSYETRVIDLDNFKAKFDLGGGDRASLSAKGSDNPDSLESILARINSLENDLNFNDKNRKDGITNKQYSTLIKEKRAEVNAFKFGKFNEHKLRQYNDAMNALERKIEEINARGIEDGDEQAIEALKKTIAERKKGVIDEGDILKSEVKKNSEIPTADQTMLKDGESYEAREMRLNNMANFKNLKLANYYRALLDLQTKTLELKLKAGDAITDVDLQELDALEKTAKDTKSKLPSERKLSDKIDVDGNQVDCITLESILYNESTGQYFDFNKKHGNAKKNKFKREGFNVINNKIFDPAFKFKSYSDYIRAVMEAEYLELRMRMLGNSADDKALIESLTADIDKLRSEIENKKVRDLGGMKIIRNETFGIVHRLRMRGSFRGINGMKSYKKIAQEFNTKYYDGTTNIDIGDNARPQYTAAIEKQITAMKKFNTDDIEFRINDLRKDFSQYKDPRDLANDSKIVEKIGFLGALGKNIAEGFSTGTGLLGKTRGVGKGIGKTLMDDSLFVPTYTLGGGVFGLVSGGLWGGATMAGINRAFGGLIPRTNGIKFAVVITQILVQTGILKIPDGAKDYIPRLDSEDEKLEQKYSNEKIDKYSVYELLLLYRNETEGKQIKEKLTNDIETDDAKALEDLEKLYISHLLDTNNNGLTPGAKKYLLDNKKDIAETITIEQAKDPNIILSKIKEYARDKNSEKLYPKSKKEIKEDGFEWLVDYPELIQENKRLAQSKRAEITRLDPSIKTLEEYFAKNGRGAAWLEDWLVISLSPTTNSEPENSTESADITNIPEIVKTKLKANYDKIQQEVTRDYQGKGIVYAYDGKQYYIKK